ncbi:MAG: hypothetical protein IKV81_05255 [Clostridia bacterium]|nr:hypothetical protein [Clostridia bacterium]
MQSKKSKIITIVSIIVVLVVYITISHWLSLQKSVDIDAEYLSSVAEDVEEVLYVKKFTNNESVAIALGKSKDDSPCVFVLWDEWNRYTNRASYKPHTSNLYKETSKTKFGQPYFGIFPNPTDDTVTVNGKEHKVFKFYATIDGVSYHLGFYCGLKNTTKDTGNHSVR